jgi:hypothetical protein
LENRSRQYLLIDFSVQASIRASQFRVKLWFADSLTPRPA